MQSGAVGHFVFEQIDKDRRAFRGLDYKQFLAKMQNPSKYFNAFQDYLSENGLMLSLEKNRGLVNRYLVAEYARQLFSEDKYFELTIREDPMIREVLSR